MTDNDHPDSPSFGKLYALLYVFTAGAVADRKSVV